MSHRPDFRRWMLFVDGENFAIRAKAFAPSCAVHLAEGYFFKDDVFVWIPNYRATSRDLYPLGYDLDWSALRAHYYTSVSGDDDALGQVRESLWNLGFTPAVFKKTRKSDKAKGVDIALTKDMLCHAFQKHYDTAVLIAGDADYIPLIEEVKRLGRRVCVVFFNDVTPRSLRLAADEFIALDEKFAQCWKEHCARLTDSER